VTYNYEWRLDKVAGTVEIQIKFGDLPTGKPRTFQVVNGNEDAAIHAAESWARARVKEIGQPPKYLQAMKRIADEQGITVSEFRKKMDEAAEMVAREQARVDSMSDREYLWQLLDDVSTMDDACKGDDAAFRRNVRRIIEKRSYVAVSEDGQTLVWVRDIR
jgi:hypothetical protein